MKRCFDGSRNELDTAANDSRLVMDAVARQRLVEAPL